MFRSIRWRLVASHVLLTLLTIGVAGLLGLWGIRYTAQQQEIRYLTNTARAIAQRAEPLLSLQADSEQLIQLAKTAAFFGNAQVRILDAQGRVLADSGLASHSDEIIWFVLPHQVGVETFVPPIEGFFVAPAPERIPLIDADAYPFPDDWTNARVTIVRRVDGPWGGHFELEPFPGVRTRLRVEEVSTNEGTQRSTRTVSVPIGSSYEPIGSVVLSSVSDFGFEAMASSWPAFLLAAVGSMALALILGLMLGGRLSKPITSLNQVAGKMGAGELSVRAPTQGKDEIGELAAQFNHMASQLETSFSQLGVERDALRRFIADASHELRTPITALQNFNELLLDASADDPLARAEFLAESQLQIERLVWITQNLLDLSRLEAGLASLELSKPDAGELIAHLKTLFEARALENAIQLTIILPENPIELHCDRGRIEMALSNLLDNALKFTPQGGEVTAGAERNEGVVHFWLEDNGIGIHPEDLPHIFERFYRGRNSDQPGSGLGLSIVQSVAKAHGGRVWAESQYNQGAKFYLEIPCGSEPGSSDSTTA